MPFWSTTLYQINPECSRDEFDNLWAEEDQEYVYDSHEGNPLYVYTNDIFENGWGQLNEIELDMLSKPYYSRREPSQRIIITNRVAIQTFRMSEWPSLVGIFGSQSNKNKFAEAIKSIYTNRTGDDSFPLLPIIFLLRDKEECLTNIFPSVRELSVEQIRGLYVRDAKIRGAELEQSPYYQEWVLDANISGRISYFGLHVLDETLNVGPFGTIYSRQGRGNDRPISKVSILIERFLKCEAILYQPELHSFA